jgi:hypothetical protein
MPCYTGIYIFGEIRLRRKLIILKNMMASSTPLNSNGEKKLQKYRKPLSLLIPIVALK